ncbi:hypothetical protein IE077_001819 [Cardiosporidium cionae]|uniref:Uncharacterized protein n=1 Tax=Cardiosporidium cionae TaxID=476202 RepID=A0ABQ7JCC7_9APIC|nr:hypothetical protein IE077_001819 [Cardiosporidium cionae]|eukprot:KAF8821598.1 hypothetical protein IE077_001819 [Cardiosporidium cionae]
MLRGYNLVILVTILFAPHSISGCLTALTSKQVLLNAPPIKNIGLHKRHHALKPIRGRLCGNPRYDKYSFWEKGECATVFPKSSHLNFVSQLQPHKSDAQIFNEQTVQAKSIAFTRDSGYAFASSHSQRVPTALRRKQFSQCLWNRHLLTFECDHGVRPTSEVLQKTVSHPPCTWLRCLASSAPPFPYPSKEAAIARSARIEELKDDEDNKKVDENSWTVLADGHILKKVLQKGETSHFPTLKSNVTIEFSISLLTGEIVTTHTECNVSMLEFPLASASKGMQTLLMTMKRLEKSAFVISPHLHKLSNFPVDKATIGEKDWLRFEILMCNIMDSNEKWVNIVEHVDASGIPKSDCSDMTLEEELELKTDLITKQLEQEMASNPSSPHWKDLRGNFSQQHEKKVESHFDKKLKRNIPRDPTVDGSRGYVESFLNKGQQFGYDLGDRIEGRGKYYVWRETPFVLEVAIPVISGVRAKHIHCAVTANAFKLFIAGKEVFGDQFIGSVDTEAGVAWTMNDAAMEFSAATQEELDTAASLLVETTTTDTISKVHTSRVPYISLQFFKMDKSLRLWGNAFEKS